MALFVKTASGKLYRSSDNGQSFAYETPNLLGKGNDEVLQLLNNEGSEHVILQGWYGDHWASKDMGDTWIQPCGAPGADSTNCFASPLDDEGGSMASLFHMHPSAPDHILARVTRKACDAADAETSGGACGHDLMYSPDFGRTWVNLRKNSRGRVWSFVDFDWAPPPVPGHEGLIAEKPAILATVYEDPGDVKKGAGKPWDYNVHFVYSADLFASPHERKLSCGNSFEVMSGKDVYVARLTDCEAYHASDPAGDRDVTFPGTDVALRVSVDRGHTFNQACFPVPLQQKGFTIFDWNDQSPGPDFIVVDHDEEDDAEARAPIGNIYSSDASGQLYSLSMRRNLYFGGAVDFVNVEGAPGVYIANQIAGSAFADPSFVAGSTAILSYVKTRVSFNGGGAWRALRPPDLDASGKPISCAGGGTCELHLHGASHWQRGTWNTRLGSVYSQPSAPGVIIATGNVGEYLSEDPHSVNTYLSRDAGATWSEILKGPHIYEFGNHGGLIVVAKMAALGSADSVQFSRDEGLSWELVPLASPMDVHNIRVDPQGVGTAFVIHGTDPQSTPGDGDQDGMVYVLDFDRLLLEGGTTKWVFPTCDAAKDYEWWSPAPPGGGCLLGKNYTMERRRRDSCCLNDKDYERTETKTETCACVRDVDTECQYGAERLSEFGECVRMESVDLNRCPALVGSRYPSSNLRIIAGSECAGDRAALGVSSFIVGGKRSGGGGGGGGVGTFFLVVFLLGACGGGAAFAYRRFDLGRFVPEELAAAAGALRDKIDELTGRRTPTPAGYFEPLGDFGGDEL